MYKPFAFFYKILLTIILSTITIHTVYAGNYVTVERGTAPTINWSVGGSATQCTGSTGYTPGTTIYSAWKDSVRNSVGSTSLPVANSVGIDWPFTCTDPSSGTADTAFLTVQDCGGSLSPGRTLWNGTACVAPPSASFTSTPSCTIAQNASNCQSPVSWTSANVTYASLTDSSSTFPTGLYGSYGPGAVTYGPPGVTIPYAPASTLEANKPKYYIHNVTAGGADLGTLASVAGTADCTVGTVWNGSTCAVPTYLCGGTIPTGPSGSITLNSTASAPNQNWTYSAPGTSACTWSCNSGYQQSGTSCVAVAFPSASFTSTPSCTIASGASTCQSPVSWTSANVTYASLTDCGGGLYTSQGAGAVTYNTNGGVTVPYGSPNAGGCYQIRQDSSTGTVLATVYSTGTCTAGTAWDGAKCTPTFYSCSGTTPTGANFTSRPAMTVNGTWAYSPAGECTWSCNSGYVQSGNTCVIQSNNLPTGVIDAVSSGSIGTCGMASGWSYDADNTSLPDGIHIYVDGPAGSGTGYNTGLTTLLRADVNAVFGITGNHGYNYQIPNLTVGNHTAYAYAIGIDTAGNPANESMSLVNNPITFNCSQTTYTVTPSVTPSNGTGGNINPNTPQTVNSGGTASFTVTPNPGYSAIVAGSCGGNTIPTTGGNYITNSITSNCTVDVTFTLNVCTAPLTQNVTVACDPIAGNSVTGLVTRSQNKSAYTDNPSCAFPALPVTNLNSTYVSDTCVYTPNSCTNQTKTWLTNCNASTGIIANGGSAFLNFNNGTYTGSATYSCDGVTDTYTYVSGSCTLIPPSTPTGFSVTPSTCGNNWITLAWNKVSTATTYTVYRGGVAQNLTAVCGADNICRVSDTGLVFGSSHSYAVTANNSGGDSTATATQSATVSSACPILYVTKDGNGTGTVTSPSGTINCGGTCSSVYNTNDAVTLSASPSVTSVFAGWGGSCSVNGGVTMSTDKTCIATFNLAVPPSTPTTFSAGPSTCGNNWINLIWDAMSTATTYTVYRDGAFLFTKDPSICGADNICRVSDTGLVFGSSHSYTVTANNFVGSSPATVAKSATTASLCATTLNVTKDGNGTGTVTSSIGTISCGATCSSIYNTSNTVTLSALPSVTSVFAGWSGDCSVNGVVTMDTNKTCTATFNLGTCPLPLTQDVTVACDAVTGYNVIGSVIRNQIKSAYPTCAFPELPVTNTNSTYVSESCVYSCINGSKNAGCVMPTIVNPVLIPNNDPSGKIIFSCSNADSYKITRNGTLIASGNYTLPVTIKLSDYGSVMGNYQIKCLSGDAEEAVTIFYDPKPLTTDSITLEATPVTIKSGTVSTLTWGINIPDPACDITASPVCAGGSCVYPKDNALKAAADTLSLKLLNETTDANDPYGANRLMSTALRTVPISSGGTKALGKKSINLQYTTDFELNCHINVEGRPNPFKKLRVQVTNDNEG